jgi:hypothetical protein
MSSKHVLSTCDIHIIPQLRAWQNRRFAKLHGQDELDKALECGLKPGTNAWVNWRTKQAYESSQWKDPSESGQPEVLREVKDEMNNGEVISSTAAGKTEFLRSYNVDTYEVHNFQGDKERFTGKFPDTAQDDKTDTAQDFQNYSRNQEDAPIVISDDSSNRYARFELRAILNSRINYQCIDPLTKTKGVLEYMPWYKDFDKELPDWQPWWDFEHAPQIVDDFHRRCPHKPGGELAI